jgi:NifU-like protein involved in Fe-S cluster formation
MTARGGAALYTPEILALAVDLARFPLDEAQPMRGDAHSRVCGSRVTVAVATDDAGRIATVGARVSACAIGQAAAALFLRSASGSNAAGIARARAEIEAWLGGSAIVPTWPGIATLASARAFPARYPAILLPWTAALAALSNRIAAD